jgi:hypothetical protein
MCQVNGCDPAQVDQRVHVTIPGHVDAKAGLCDGHAELYEREGYLGGLIVPDGTWAEYLEQHGPVTQG